MTIRLHAKLLLVLISALAAVGLSGCGSWVVKVNGKAIDEETFNRRLVEMQARFAGQAPAEGDEGFNNFRGTVAEDLAVRLMLKDEAERQGLSISEEEVDQGLVELKKLQFSGDEQKFQEALDKQGITPERAREQLAEGMLIAKLKMRVVSETPEPTDDDAKIEFEKNPKKYELAASVKLRQIQLASQEEANQVLERLKAGEDMAALASSLSQDPSSKDKGGDLGWVLKGSIEESALEQVVFSLSPGGTCEPVQSKSGWHIFRVEDAKAAYQRTFEESKETVKKELLEQAQDSYWSGWLVKMKEAAHIEYRDGYRPPEVQ